MLVTDTEKELCDWRWQMQQRIRSLSSLRQTCPDLYVPQDSPDDLPMAVTPYYLSVIQQSDADSARALLRMCLPSADEQYSPSFLHDDPHAEAEHMSVPGLVHRYPDRALLVTTSECAVQCRHCMRKRGWTHGNDTATLDLDEVVDYLVGHPGIRDVLLSGGDPLCMETSRLLDILLAVRSVPSVDIIRIGTRVPVTLPMRVDSDLVSAMQRVHPLYVNTHFNHPAEMTTGAATACQRLADGGIPLGNQTVLLKGVNDDVATLECLFRGLLRLRVKPYYLFQCDLVSGVEHFRTPLSVGLDIMRDLRQLMGGLGIPTFAVDAPGAGSKIPLLPDYISDRSETSTTFRDPDGNTFVYPEPVEFNPTRR